MILRFVHGWGFAADFWNALTPLLSDFAAQCDDRGYFGKPSSAESAGPCIVVAHSFGAMRALAAPPPHCRGLVAINGFDRFAGAGAVSARVVDRMIARFAEDPGAVLTDFRRRCGDEAPFGPADLPCLGADLGRLRHDDRSADSARWAVPLLSLQGAEDPLLPPPMRNEVFAAAPLLERMTHPSGGHLLPIEDAAYCARAVRAFAERLR